MDSYSIKAEKIRDAILSDVTCRRGWRQEWDGFDDDIRDEIRETWLAIIRNILVIEILGER